MVRLRSNQDDRDDDKARGSEGPLPGRPSSLTPDVVNRILSAIRCGATNKTSCEAAGVSESTLYRWLDRAKDGNDPDCSEFSRRLHRARQEGVTARLALIQKAATKGDWRAAAWLLERDQPDSFSMKLLVSRRGGPLSLTALLQQLDEDLDPDDCASEEDT